MRAAACLHLAQRPQADPAEQHYAEPKLRHCTPFLSRAHTCELGLEHRKALLRLGCARLELGQGCGVHAAAACGACGVAATAMRCGPQRRRRQREQAAAELLRRGCNVACTPHPVTYLSVPERAPRGTAGRRAGRHRTSCCHCCSLRPAGNRECARLDRPEAAASCWPQSQREWSARAAQGPTAHLWATIERWGGRG